MQRIENGKHYLAISAMRIKWQNINQKRNVIHKF